MRTSNVRALPGAVAPIALGSILVVGSLTLPGTTQAGDAREDLLATDRAFSEQSAAEGRAAAFADYAAPDAILFRDGAAPLSGSAAIKENLATRGPGSLTWTPRDASVATSGELGYTWGDYVFRPGSSEKVYTGHYVSIWKRQPDNHWKWVVDIGNSDPAP